MIVQSQRRGGNGAKEALYGKAVSDVRLSAREKEGRFDPLLKQLNFCNSGPVNGAASSEIYVGVIGAAIRPTCADKAFFA
jgi:hypothetical protein